MLDFSTKSEKILGSLIEIVEGVKENETVSNKGESMDKFCATRWTLSSKIITQSSIQQLREKCLAETLTRNVALKDSWTSRSMITSDFYF